LQALIDGLQVQVRDNKQAFEAKLGDNKQAFEAKLGDNKQAFEAKLGEREQAFELRLRESQGKEAKRILHTVAMALEQDAAAKRDILDQTIQSLAHLRDSLTASSYEALLGQYQVLDEVD